MLISFLDSQHSLPQTPQNVAGSNASTDSSDEKPVKRHIARVDHVSSATKTSPPLGPVWTNGQNEHSALLTSKNFNIVLVIF